MSTSMPPSSTTTLSTSASSYQVTHLQTNTTFTRPSVFLNPHYRPPASPGPTVSDPDPAIERFHRSLPSYNTTPLHSLPHSKSLQGQSHVFLKDESTRFGLPSFKIAGASWAVHRALCRHLHLNPETSGLDEVKAALRTIKGTQDQMSLVTSTDGNWGRAVARMASYYEIKCRVYVPWFVNAYVRDLIAEEGGAEVVRVEQGKDGGGGTYDDSIQAVRHYTAENERRALMVMDVAWEGYEEIPGWVTEGYSTILRETDRQAAEGVDTPGKGGERPVLAFVSVGVGSWAHAVVEHYAAGPGNLVVTVEPEASACLKESLHCGELTSIKTGETIMNGMNCGTPSTIAWPVLRSGVYAAVTVTDMESHECVQELHEAGINVGPCGAATLAAFRKFYYRIPLAEMDKYVVVLFSTEGPREYEPPKA